MKAVLYGIGQRFHDLFDNNENRDVGLMVNEIEIIGFADSNSDIWGREIIYHGLRFIIRDIKEIPPCDYENILIVSKNYFEEICSILYQKGFKKEHIYRIDDFLKADFEQINFISNEYLNKQWNILDRAGGSVGSFLESENYKEIAVYGTDALSERLINDLKQSNLNLQYVIGNKSNKYFSEIPILETENDLPETDIIVVSATDENYMNVERKICEKNPIKVISIRELIYKVLKNLNEG